MSRFEHMYQRWGDTVRFLMWGLTLALVCFLLYRVIVNDSGTQLVPLSGEERDSLMTVAMPGGMSDTLLRYDAFDVHFNSRRASPTARAMSSLTTNSTEQPSARASLCPTPA